MDISELNLHRHTVATRTGPASYLDVGAGPVALLVHGLGTSALLWRNAIGLLAARRRCIAIDLPLHGQTPAADQDLSLPGLASFIEDVCTALDLTDIDLVANDTGGAVAQIFAAEHPSRLHTLTLTNCETHDNLPPRALAATVLLARLGLLAPIGRRSLRDVTRARSMVYGSGYQDIAALPLEVARAYLTPLLGTKTASEQLQRLIVSLRAQDLLAVEPQLARLQVPTLIVWGTGDRFFDRSWAYWLHDAIPGADPVVEIPDARLFFVDERAGELVDALTRHWASHTRHSGTAAGRS